ncbi:hypothetical protein FS749_005759 [Ceratobasidium sp. UAMH 11750]|nr:hypothetical protein FS749_005759 [Ceratobasidium sp. UAMH 11750]
MPARSPKESPLRHSPYPKRQRTKSGKSALAESTSPPTLSKPKPKQEKQHKQTSQADPPPDPAPVLHSPLFNGINPVYLARSMRAIARGNYSYAHGYLHLCILQARHAASSRGGVSATVVFLLMIYSDNWLRLGIPVRAVISMEDALIAQEQMGEESEEDRTQAALAGLELREFMHSDGCL